MDYYVIFPLTINNVTIFGLFLKAITIKERNVRISEHREGDESFVKREEEREEEDNENTRDTYLFNDFHCYKRR